MVEREIGPVTEAESERYPNLFLYRGLLRKMTPEGIAEAVRLRAEGWTQKAIASRLKVSRSTIRYYTDPNFKPRIRNWEKVRRVPRDWTKHAEFLKDYDEERRKDQPNHVRKKDREYYSRWVSKPEARGLVRANVRKYYWKHRQERIEYIRRWREQNPEKVLEYRRERKT